jgi:antitoxin YefM
MNAINYSTVRNTLARAMTRVVDNHEAIIITRKKGKNAVLMSLEDYEALIETAYLLRSPANAKRLLKAVSDVKAKTRMRKRALTSD